MMVSLLWRHLFVEHSLSVYYFLLITARCSLRDDFNGNVAIFNVYKWRHSDVIVIKLTTGTQN